MHAENITLTFQPDGRTLQHATLVNQASVVLTEAKLRKSIAGSRIDVDHRAGWTDADADSTPSDRVEVDPAAGQGRARAHHSRRLADRDAATRRRA